MAEGISGGLRGGSMGWQGLTLIPGTHQQQGQQNGGVNQRLQVIGFD